MFTPDLDLIRKYNQPGPRYTSYPTAPHFSEDTDKAALAAQTETEDSDLSLYFHIAFCRSLCWFCGCTKIITTHRTRPTTRAFFSRSILTKLPSCYANVESNRPPKTTAESPKMELY